MKLKLSLLENSYDFLNTALYYVIQSETNHAAWKFAIINIVQAMELMFKEKLRQTHELFVFDNIDKPRHTVSISQAIDRLISVCNIDFDPNDKSIIGKAIEWRNQMMHYEVDISLQEIKARYALLFEFLSNFHKDNLDGELHEYVLPEFWAQEADLIELFKNEFIIYNGATISKNFVQEILWAQELIHYYIDGQPYPRVQYGLESAWQEANAEFASVSCHDCDIIKGQLHVPGCDMEVCPKCGKGAVICGCKYDENEEGYIIFGGKDGKKYT